MNTQKIQILIIDDDEDILGTLTTVLYGKGYIAEVAKTGADAIKKSKARFYNIALIDIVLPDIQGTQLLAKLMDTMPKMRKVIITGHATLKNAVEAINLGADAYIQKPINPNKLLKIIEQQLRNQQEEFAFSQGKVTEYIESQAKKLKRGKNRNGRGIPYLTRILGSTARNLLIEGQ